MSTNAAPRPKNSVDVRLRSREVAYLEYLAERDEISVSKAFGLVVERHAQSAETLPRRPIRKVRSHFWMKPEHLVILDRLAVKWGVFRSDVARRLIGQALAEDPELR